MTKRILSALLAAVLSLGVLVSCAGGDEGKTDDTTPAVTGGADTAVTEPAEETTTGRENAKDNIPADLRFDGETVSMIYRNENGDYYGQWDMIGTDNSGDVIFDAVWQRNMNVEDRFGITLNIQPTQATGLSNVASELKNMVFSGSDEYDVICSTSNTTISQSLYPYLYELSGVEHLDITQPWWRTDAVMGLSFDGEHYRYLMGDNTLNAYLRCGVIYYNKDIYTDVTQADADELYQTVIDGTWTYDVLTELTAQAYTDLNGDGAENVGDQFGLMMPKGHTEAIPHMAYGCDIDTLVHTDGKIDLSPFNNEKNVAVMDKLIALIHETTGVYESDKSIDASPAYFAENNSLFYAGRMSNAAAATMREMESDYGILPMPKFDAEQKDYVTFIHNAAVVTCVPKTVADNRINMVGAVLEGLASESYRTVMTPFIETALKMKYSRDALSGQVIDIIFDTAMVDMMYYYNSNMNSLFTTALQNPVAAGKNNFSSIVAKLLNPAQKSLDKYVSEVVEADN
ncbi:MAG: hypothetical protein IJD06_01405 [Clostridia bacterium]|nr:hypothetical protein [Clostridia bacterium]